MHANDDGYQPRISVSHSQMILSVAKKCHRDPRTLCFLVFYQHCGAFSSEVSLVLRRWYGYYILFHYYYYGSNSSSYCCVLWFLSLKFVVRLNTKRNRVVWLTGVATVWCSVTRFIWSVPLHSIELIQHYVTADEAGSVMDLLSLICASAQDLAFLSALWQHLPCQMIFSAPRWRTENPKLIWLSKKCRLC